MVLMIMTRKNQHNNGNYLNNDNNNHARNVEGVDSNMIFIMTSRNIRDKIGNHENDDIDNTDNKQ